MKITPFLFLLCVMGTFSACTKKAPADLSNMSSAELMQRGISIYQMNCTSCHHQDPKKDGPLGPSVVGSSKELLVARLVRAQYPDGYKPKRSTAQMPALPHLEAEIPALEAYLNALESAP